MGPDTNHLTKDIVQNLIKAKKTLRMYPENNPIYIKTVDAAFAIVQEYLDFHDELALKIRQFEVICDGEQVYHNPGKDDNFALFFFKDGVRDLTFRKGLVREELEDFLKIIAFDFDSVTDDDDVVTMMWERDFQHIGYIVDETYLMDDQDYEGSAVKEIREKSAGDDEVLRAYREAFDVEGVGSIPVIPLTDHDVETLKRDLDADVSESGRKLRHMLLEMFYMADTGDELQELVSLCKGAIDFSLQYVDVEGVCAFVRKADALLVGEGCPETIKPSLRAVVKYINSDRVIKLVGDLLDSGAEVEAEKFDQLFSLMDTGAIPSLIKILGELSSIHARKAIINSLIILGKRDLAAISKGLGDSRWYVVRNIIYVFRHIGDRRAVEYLVKKLRHDDIRVKKEIIKALGELGGGEVVQHLRGFIDSSDSGLRALAAKALAQSKSPAARKILVEKISSADFRNRDFAEKKEFFEALSHWRDPELVGLLDRILRRSSLFRRARVTESRACAAYALGMIGSKEALEVLRKFRNVNNALIREYVNIAIMRIDRGIPADRS